MTPFPPAVVLCIEDLLFSERMADAVRHLGGSPVAAGSQKAFLRAMDQSLPVLALLDLHIDMNWEATIRTIRLRPHTRAVPIYGFGRHTEPELLARARRAGADHAWARSRIVEELPDLLHRHINPPLVMPDGGLDPLSADAVEGVRLFNARRYHAQHEAFEDAWNAEPRPVREMYQGILQIGLAFLQLQNRNRPGVIKMFGRGVPRLRPLPDVVQDVRIRRFLDESLQVFQALSDTRKEPDWSKLERTLPSIHLAEPG